MKKRPWVKITVWTLVLTVIVAVGFYGAYLYWMRNMVDYLPLAEETVACVDFGAVARNLDFFEARGFDVRHTEDGRAMRLANETGMPEVYIIITERDDIDSYRLPYDGDVYISWATPDSHYRSEWIGKFELTTAIQGENAYMNVYHGANNPWKGVEELDAFIQQLFADLAEHEVAK